MEMKNFVIGIVIFCVAVTLFWLAYINFITGSTIGDRYNITENLTRMNAFNYSKDFEKMGTDLNRNLTNSEPSALVYLYTGVLSLAKAGITGLKVTYESIGITDSITNEITYQYGIPIEIKAVIYTILFIVVGFIFINVFLGRDQT